MKAVSCSEFIAKRVHRASLLLQAIVVNAHISSALLLHGSVSPRMTIMIIE